jgi:hypothetical protein
LPSAIATALPAYWRSLVSVRESAASRRSRDRARRPGGSVSGRNQLADGEHAEHPAPAGEPEHLPADHRGEHRREPEDQHQRPEHAGELAARVQVADDRQRQHHAGGPGHALQEPERDQRADVGRGRARDR